MSKGKEIIKDPLFALGAGVLLFFVLKRYGIIFPDGTNVGKGSFSTKIGNQTSAQVNYAVRMQRLGMDQIGTSFTPMYDSLKGFDQTALKAVFNKFGVIPYFIVGRVPWLGTRMNLWEWYRAELKSHNLQKMRDLWAAQGLYF